MLEPAQLAVLPLWYAVFLLALTAHEAAHAWVAWRGGDATAYHGGQVTLNPLPHIRREPMGTVIIPIISFVLTGFTMGWASAPYDPVWEKRYPRRAALMALAGPLANLSLAILGLLLLRLGLELGVWLVPGEASIEQLVMPASPELKVWDALGRMCSILFALNLLLFLFNLFPFPPLDGAAVVAGLFTPARRLSERVVEAGAGGLLGLVAAWFVVSQLYGPLFWWLALNTLYRGLAG